jgi:hypothetical protein
LESIRKEELLMAFYAEDQLSWALARILELEEALEEAKDTINQLVGGNACRWDL